MNLLKPLLIALFGMLAPTGTAAHAQTAYAAGQGSVNRLDIGIDVRASVTGRCGFATAPNGTITQSKFDETGFSRDIPLVLNCSGASRVAVTSAKGGLQTATTGATGYATKAPYDVTLRLVADNGTTATATCAASTLTAGGSCSTFGGPASSSKGLRLAGASTKANGSYVRVSAPAYSGSAPLVAGTYSDTITVTVSAAP